MSHKSEENTNYDLAIKTDPAVVKLEPNIESTTNTCPHHQHYTDNHLSYDIGALSRTFLTKRKSKRRRRSAKTASSTSSKALTKTSRDIHKLRKVGHKSKNNFLNNFEIDVEQEASSCNGETRINSNFDVFHLNTSSQAVAGCRNMFQPLNNSAYSKIKLLPWEQTVNRYSK